MLGFINKLRLLFKIFYVKVNIELLLSVIRRF